MPRLVVILGAGASYDCATRDAQLEPLYQPPLVTGLFGAQATYASILNPYPLAEASAPEIRAIPSGMALETFLRDRLLKSPHEYDRRRFWAIPLYFQHLLFECGGNSRVTRITMIV